MKYSVLIGGTEHDGSHPARGAWIEISRDTARGLMVRSRTPQGVRGLKCLPSASISRVSGRTPQGVRGLKLQTPDHGWRFDQVAPRKGCVD